MTLSEIRHMLSLRITLPFVRAAEKVNLTPNMLTITGFVVSLGAAAVIAQGSFLVGGLLVLFASFFDLIDGALARAQSHTTRFGALLDSTLDRLSEVAVLFGILWFSFYQEDSLGVFLAFAVLAISTVVSYLRARGEGLGFDCEVGIFTRPGRIIAIALGLLTGQVNAFLALTAALSLITAGQRFTYLKHKIGKERYE
jgi:CDP-diacylglycerol--glycerol-3-phosphate 3-phosphatidyltransferase